MKRRALRTIRAYLAASLLVVSPLSVRAGVLPEQQTWELMQSLGGISIGTPYRENAIWYLPVSCDVSGRTKVTVQPTMLNSALAAGDVKVDVNGSAVSITVVTRMASHNKSPLCKPAALGSLREGTYSVSYRDPDGTQHELGRIELK